MNPIKSFTSRGKRWKFRITPPVKGDVDGDTDGDLKRVQINGNLEGRGRLETILHEFLHTASWDLSEEAVIEIAEDGARLLWRLGYRCSDD